jgi:hypothetical protein
MDDTCEQYLAQQFRPAMSSSSYDCGTGGEPYWAAKYFPNQGNVVRIIYMPAYYVDCGSPLGGYACTVGTIWEVAKTVFVEAITLATVPFQIEDPCRGHNGDAEFVLLDVTYSEGTQHWALTHAFLSAHFQDPTDRSASVGPDALAFPNVYQGYPLIWVSEGKHANYISRDVCISAVYGESCEGNPIHGARLGFNGTHNIGSIQANMISTHSCVAGGQYHDLYPDSYGVECFWQDGADARFSGWAPVHQAGDAEGYITPLVLKFECYSTVYDGATHQESCTDRGVAR